MVIDQEGTKKVAQYGQWDGYPSGVGADVLKFLKDKQSFDKFKANLKKVRFLEQEGRDKEFVERYDANAPSWTSQPDSRTDEQKRWFDTYCTRDLSAKVLTNIADSEDSEILLLDREETGKNNSSVEYCYLIDLNKNTFEVYNHIDEDVLKVYSLDSLPDEDVFVADISKAEGAEDDE